MAEEKKTNARENALQQMGGINIGNQINRAMNPAQPNNGVNGRISANQTPD
jgi:hypothetical protein